jgi:Tol biopolymer transport system component
MSYRGVGFRPATDLALRYHERASMQRHRLLTAILILTVLLPGGVAAQTPVASPEASPVTSGAGWRIAGDREIDLDTRHAVLSPDGALVAGVGPEDTICVWVVETLAASCADERLPIREETIVWSPDGTAVAFALDAIRLLYESDIYVYDVQRGQLANLTDDGVEGDLLDTIDADPPMDDVPTWSPDSRRIAFVRSYRGDEEPGSTTIMRIDRAGGEPVEVLPLDVDEPFAIWLPMHWLPDGTLLYSQMAHELGDPRNGVWKVGVDDGSSPLQIAPGAEESDIPGPTISAVDPASGTAIVYSYLLAGQFGAGADQPLFWLVDLATGDRSPLPTPPGDARVIAAGFAPDGGTILLVTMSSEGAVLMTMDPATGEVAPLDPVLRDMTFRPVAPQWAANNTVLLQRPQGPLLLTMAAA